MKATIFALVLVLGISSAYAQATICPKHTVVPGDSLYSIAQKYSALPDDLTAAISACGQNAANLQIGQELCLPGSEKPGCVFVKSYDGKDTCKVYVVQQGDTIDQVATNLGIYNVELSNLNSDVVDNGLLQPNKYLKLPSWSQTCGDPNQAGDSCRVYIVIGGDYLDGIARAFGVSPESVLAANPGLQAGAVLQNGQPVKIPPFPASCGAGIPTKPPTDTVLKCRGYRVQTGDNLNTIAIAFKSTVSDIVAVNSALAGGGLVQPGTIVLIPPTDSTCGADPILVPLPGSEGPPMPPSSPIPSPSPIIMSPIPVVASPSPAVVALPPPAVVALPPPAVVALPPPAVVASPSPAVMSPSPAAVSPLPAPIESPSPAPVESPSPSPSPSGDVVVTAAPPPVSAAVSVKAALGAIFAVIAAMAL